MEKFNRREFLSLATGIAAAAMAGSGCLHASEEPAHADRRKHNLLFIWTDE
jgi:hypothetical protein